MSIEGDIVAEREGEKTILIDMPGATDDDNKDDAAKGISNINIVAVKWSGDPRKSRKQDGSVPEKNQINQIVRRVYSDKCSKSYTDQKALTRHENE